MPPGVSGIAGILAFLYIPIAVLVAYSFNDSRSLSWPMTGFTLDWYVKLSQNEQLITPRHGTRSMSPPAPRL
ncbi:hypothetical protein [uncultured Roseibium sp.]|uniref:ABC transporter permease n=1 Tax=uncultured Roseibium sp. TaxID=1936171 RepID=UPI00321709A1